MSLLSLDYLLWDNERTLVKVMRNVRVLITVSDAMHHAKQNVFMPAAQDNPLHVYARLSSTVRVTRSQRVRRTSRCRPARAIQPDGRGATDEVADKRLPSSVRLWQPRRC